MQDLRTDLRKEVEGLLKRNPSGLTVTQIVDRTEAPRDQVRSLINRLRDKLHIRAISPGQSNTAYRWHEGEAQVAKPNTTNRVGGDVYTCPELRRIPGLPASRYAAFDLPSVRGNRRIWPNGDWEYINGQANS
jgi:hypothetical protein